MTTWKWTLAAQLRASFARASGRAILPMAVAVVLTNLIGWAWKI